MTKQRAEALIRKRIGEIPILQTVIQRLRLREIVLSYIKPHGNETVPAVDTLLVLVWNIACGRQPLYELPEWVAKLDGGLLGHTVDAAENPYGDDRFARALDKLYAADRASMVTDIALRVIETTEVDLLSELHNDSSTVKSFGNMPGKTATGLYFTQGHSKDHRPDLKLSHIVRHGGHVVTLMPETWREAGDFKATLRQTVKAKKRILRRPLLNDEESYETFYCYSGQYRTEKGRYPLHERVEAIMLLFFLALILQAVIERDVRQNMRASNIDALSLYPEHRLAYHPTTAKMFERFQDISNYRVVEGNQVIKVYRDEITDLHKEILALLGMTEKSYWQKVA